MIRSTFLKINIRSDWMIFDVCDVHAMSTARLTWMAVYLHFISLMPYALCLMPLDAFRCVGLVWNVGQTCRLYVGGTSMVPAAQTAHYECGHLI